MSLFPFRLLRILQNTQLLKGVLIPMPLDPVTAGINCLTVWGQVLLTEQGQQFFKMNNELMSKIFSHLEGHITAAAR